MFVHFRPSKKVRDNRGARKIRAAVEIVLSHSIETLIKVTFRYVTSFWYCKIFCFREKCHVFPAEILSHSTENFRGETFLSFTNFLESKILWTTGDEASITIFFQSFLCLTMPKIFVGQPICAVFQKISVNEKV